MDSEDMSVIIHIISIFHASQAYSLHVKFFRRVVKSFCLSKAIKKTKGEEKNLEN